MRVTASVMGVLPLLLAAGFLLLSEVRVGCAETEDSNCGCEDGFVCEREGSKSCIKEKECGKGTEVKRYGSFHYNYECEICTNNTFSDTVKGKCKPLKRCEALNMITVFPGNSTHDAECHLLHENPEEKGSPQLLVIVIVIALVLFSLCLLAFLVNDCIWRKKFRKLKCPAKPINFLNVNETSVYALSEEERGDRPDLEYKSSLLLCDLPLYDKADIV